jgi:hypothetical protein
LLAIPGSVGVNIHFNRAHKTDLDMLASAGFRFVRNDLVWEGIERSKDQYDWSGYDELVEGLARRGIRTIFILDYSNPLYEAPIKTTNTVDGSERQETASPRHAESVAAFARWAAAAAVHFSSYSIVWEIWNEPNTSFWKPKPDVEEYYILASTTANAIRKASPQATVIGPATSGIPLDFLESLFKLGALQYLDAISIHPYRGYSLPPESAAEGYSKVRALIEKYGPTDQKRNMAIISGEWGYSSYDQGVSLDVQAAFLARQQLANLMSGIPLSVWYDWKDGTEASQREQNFGIVTHDLKPKPAYLAVQILTSELSAYRIDKGLRTASDKEYVLLCRNQVGDEKLAAWTLNPPGSLSLSLSESVQPIRVVTSDGRYSSVNRSQGDVHFELSAAPVYISLGMARVRTDSPR